jgi:uncharacterized protein YbgA (DUF1722 family)
MSIMQPSDRSPMNAVGRVPLVVPLTLFGHHIRRRGVPCLADQVYLRPHPVELMLRNHL